MIRSFISFNFSLILLGVFGGLKGVFEARPEQLMSVQGVGETQATLISMMLPLTRICLRCEMQDPRQIANRRELENYCKVTAIEARTLLDMARRHILPAVSRYTDYLAQAVFHKSGCGVVAGARMEQATLRKLSLLNDKLYDLCEVIDLHLHKAPPAEGDLRTAEYYRDHVAVVVSQAGELINQMEALTDAGFWPYPTYAEILFSV